MRRLLSLGHFFMLGVFLSGMMVSSTAYSQKKKKSQKTVRELYGVDSLPSFKYGTKELDTVCLYLQKQTWDVAIGRLGVKVKLKFVVDTSGFLDSIVAETHDFIFNEGMYEFFSEKSAKLFFANEAIRVIQLTSGLWRSAWLEGRKKGFRVNHLFVFRQNSEKASEMFKETPSDAALDIASIFGLNASDFFNIAVRKMRTEKWHLGILYFTENLRQKFTDKDSLYNLGICYKKTGQDKKACNSWKAASKLGDAQAESLVKKYCTN